MAETAANLVEHVLLTQAPLRQLVLTLPFELRARLAYDGKLLAAVCHAFVDSVLVSATLQSARPPRRRKGAVIAVQRVSSDLRLNPHFHTLCLDGPRPRRLCATLHGFSLHAATTARADDPAGREALCKHVLRPSC